MDESDNQSSSSSSSSENSDEEIVVRQPTHRAVPAVINTYAASISPPSKTLQVTPPQSTEHKYQNKIYYDKQNNEQNGEHKVNTSNITQTESKNLEEEEEEEEEEEHHQQEQLQYENDDTESDNNSIDSSIRERDIYDYMLMIPDYATIDRNSQIARNFRLILRSIPKILINTTDENNNSLFLIACQYSCIDLVNILLKHEADVHIVNKSGANGLHFACYKDSLSMSIVETLLEYRINVNLSEYIYGCTPLHYAASTGNMRLCQLLLQHGAYIHVQDYDGCSSIDYAKDAGMYEIANYLIEQQSYSNNQINHNNSTNTQNNKHRMIVNTNSESFEDLHTAIGDNDTTTIKMSTIYDVKPDESSGKSVHFSDTNSIKGGNTIPTHTSTTSTTNTKHTSSGNRGNTSIDSISSIRGYTSNNNNSSSSSTDSSVAAVSPKKVSFQPNKPSPYTTMLPSPVSKSNSTVNKNMFSSSSGTTSGSGTNGGSGGAHSTYYTLPPSPPKAVIDVNTSNRSSRATTSGSNNIHSLPHQQLLQSYSTVPQIPAPTYTTTTTNSDYNYDTNDKFEIAIERAKVNAKINKERSLQRELLNSKDKKILSLENELSTMHNTIFGYKVNALYIYCTILYILLYSIHYTYTIL